MRSFFQSRSREQAQAPTAAQSIRSSARSDAIPQIRANMDEGVTVSELSDLEARALCAREGIPHFWRDSAAKV